MTYSPLTDKVMPPTGRFWNGRTWVDKWQPRPDDAVIDGLNVHHWASTSLAGLNRLVSSSDPASANYLILNDGTLVGSVPEEYRAWTTSAYAHDDDKITVEIQNETGAPHWRISDAAMATLVRLHRDVADRHGYPADRAHLHGHQEYGIATACPGPYLLPRLDDVARQAAALTTTVQEDDMTPELAARLDQIVAWIDQRLNDLAAQAEANRNLLAGFTRDTVTAAVADDSPVDVADLATRLVAGLGPEMAATLRDALADQVGTVTGTITLGGQE